MADKKFRVLIVEDSAALAEVYAGYLRDEPYVVTHVCDGTSAMSYLERSPPEALLLDLRLPDMNGMDILKHVHRQQMSTSVVIITGHGSVDAAVDAMRYGAFDFIEKPFNAKRLTVTLRNALDRQRLTALVESIREDFQREHYHGFIGGSLQMQTVYRIIDSAAPSKATVFITGESGTGKEVCAQAIHRQSQRREAPFVALNCGAIPRDLMESEIFGHVKGAFTGAVKERVGAAGQADSGTLFLDEIAEMDLDLQTKLHLSKSRGHAARKCRCPYHLRNQPQSADRGRGRPFPGRSLLQAARDSDSFADFEGAQRRHSPYCSSFSFHVRGRRGQGVSRTGA